MYYLANTNIIYTLNVHREETVKILEGTALPYTTAHFASENHL